MLQISEYGILTNNMINLFESYDFRFLKTFQSNIFIGRFIPCKFNSSEGTLNKNEHLELWEYLFQVFKTLHNP